MKTQHIMQVALGRRGRVSRRSFLRGIAGGAAGVGALSWLDLVGLQAQELRAGRMACILLWMQGGPSQFETFDPKPGNDNGGPTSAIDTSVPGIQIAEHWPRVAQVMDDVALVRSMTNSEGNHQRATFQLHTGYVPSGSVRYPSFGSVVASQIGDTASDLPDFVSVGPTEGAGLLGAAYDPFVVNPGRLPPNTQLPVGEERFSRRLDLLGRLEADFAEAGGAREVADHRTLYARSARMITSPDLRAFDLQEEPASVRAAYGEDAFGQGCLMARRLIEAGVVFVEVRSGGWDTHQDNFNRSAQLAGQVDPGFAQLVTDLKERGLLERTLVVWMGEFGRTPRINGNSGRDHFPRAFNVALAGAGVRGGKVVGSTTPDGMAVAERPVSVPDLFCSFCRSLGIDPRHDNMSPEGRPVPIVEGGAVVEELFA